MSTGHFKKERAREMYVCMYVCILFMPTFWRDGHWCSIGESHLRRIHEGRYLEESKKIVVVFWKSQFLEKWLWIWGEGKKAGKIVLHSKKEYHMERERQRQRQRQSWKLGLDIYIHIHSTPCYEAIKEERREDVYYTHYWFLIHLWWKKRQHEFPVLVCS